MISQKVGAGRGGDLAPAPEAVSADPPEYSPALITKQANYSAERFELVRSLSRYSRLHAGPVDCYRCPGKHDHGTVPLLPDHEGGVSMSAPHAPAAARETSGQGLPDILAEHALGTLPSDDVLRGLVAAGVDLAPLIRRWYRRVR